MIPYLIGIGIGYIVNELIHEEKAKKAEEKPADTTTPDPEPHPTANPSPEGNSDTNNDDSSGEGEKQVTFVAKSRGKKK